MWALKPDVAQNMFLFAVRAQCSKHVCLQCAHTAQNMFVCSARTMLKTRLFAVRAQCSKHVCLQCAHTAGGGRVHACLFAVHACLFAVHACLFAVRAQNAGGGRVHAMAQVRYMQVA